MLTNVAFDSYRDQASALRVLPSSLNQKDLNTLSKIFDLDDIDLEIIRLVEKKERVQAKEIALHIFLSRDASRKRAIKLTKKEILKAVRAKARSPGAIQQPFDFYLSAEVYSILSEIKALDLVDFSHSSLLKFQGTENFAYLKKNQSLEEKIRSFSVTRRDVFFLVVTLEQATSTLIAKELGNYSQAVRYHLEWLRANKWIERSSFLTNPNAYHYFLNTKIDRQIVESIVNADRYKLKQKKQMNSEQKILFEQEIPKLNAVDKDLLIEICNHPGLLSNELGDNISCSMQTKNKHLNKLIKVKLARREKDLDFQGIRYYYYPALSLTAEIVERCLALPIYVTTNQNDITKKTNMNDPNSSSTLSNYPSDTQPLSTVPDLFSRLNYINEEERKIEEEEKKIQKRRSKIEKLKQEMISKGGEEAEKFFSRR